MVFMEDEIKKGIMNAIEKKDITLMLGWLEEIDWISYAKKFELICNILEGDWEEVKQKINEIFEEG